MKRLLIASNNQGKIREIKEILADFHVDIVSLHDLGIDIDVPETGSSFQENAALKAETLAARTKLPTLADDSGLSVDALGGEPGIFSARYSGPDKNSQRNIAKLLKKLTGVPTSRRAAHFICVIALSIPGKPTRFAEGRCDGVIAEAPRGRGGFGYDPVFFVPDRKQTFAEIRESEKDKISHRGRALREFRRRWPEWTGERL
ncbi:MAG: XTP/dITP diphosphatase [Sporolactobacillus sp.]|nr:XTP/dITP diphosphatase [Sporolactobacillus sp.]MCI1883054.1 XTP/dITP diphosphatase [Sporolactobacillus sp.]